PRLLENKDIFRAMLTDMKRNFEEHSDSIIVDQVEELSANITVVKQDLNKLTRECLASIEAVGKGQQAGLEELFKNTQSRLEELIQIVDTRVKSAKQDALNNEEACTRISEASRVEEEPAFSKEKQQAVAALNECRTRADNALETSISSCCLQLENLSEELQ